MHGFGRVRTLATEPPFHAPWEGRVMAMMRLWIRDGRASIDAFRHAIERMHPTAYLTTGYYGRWLKALETLLAEMEPRSSASPPAATGVIRTVTAAPRFRIGQAVCGRNLHPSGHTRLPRYVRGKHGVVVRVHPACVFPDTNAHGLGENPQHVYSVRFVAIELWGADGEPGTSVHLDLFESYLEPS
jgi:nitrile hydratase